MKFYCRGRYDLFQNNFVTDFLLQFWKKKKIHQFSLSTCESRTSLSINENIIWYSFKAMMVTMVFHVHLNILENLGQW